MLSNIKGIGAKRIEALAKKNIFSTWDLLEFFPIRYQDMTKSVALSKELDGKEVMIRGFVTASPTSLYLKKLHTTKAVVDVDGVKITCMWFNQPYMKSNIHADCEYFFYGKIKENKGKYSMMSPSFGDVNANKMQGIVPKYSKIQGVSSSVISKACHEILTKATPKSIIPLHLQHKYNLSNLADSYSVVHMPENIDDVPNARKRIAMENAVKTLLSYKINVNTAVKNNKYCGANCMEILQQNIDFPLYSSQVEALNEIYADMRSDRAMNRLLQGDVGSGKSMVMLGASILSAVSGCQTAVLCPTTTLAKQHYKTFKAVCDSLDISVELLLSTTKNSKEVIERLKHGDIDIIIGTSSLIGEQVVFNNLSLVIIDEQQKFGVLQRQKLIEKGENVDLLAVTATPIPRSLSLIIYGEVAVSYIKNDRGLSNVATHIIAENKVVDCYGFIEKQVQNGGLAYVVCPKIYDEEQGEEDGVIAKTKELKKVFNNRKIGLLHGGMARQEREKATDEFMNDKLDILVSTSVIEVGIDNQNANIIVVFGAENFGLSSLHQLRGRVGRKGQQSYCILVVDDCNEEQLDRLKYFKTHNDGFAIADYDLKVRGAGEYLGTSQHGKNDDEFINTLSFSDVKTAKDIVDEMVENLTMYNLNYLYKEFYSDDTLKNLN